MKRHSSLSHTVYAHSMQAEWEATKNPKLWRKLLYENNASGETAYLMKADAGAFSPSHTHEQVEQIFVLEGSYADRARVVRKGDYVRRPAGVAHEFKSDEGALMLVLYAAGD
jgi:quercetin dioxygenase-like cupin family protein